MVVDIPLLGFSLHPFKGHSHLDLHCFGPFRVLVSGGGGHLIIRFQFTSFSHLDLYRRAFMFRGTQSNQDEHLCLKGNSNQAQTRLTWKI